MEIDIEIEDCWTDDVDWPALAAHAADAAGKFAAELVNSRLAVSIVFTNNDEIQALNQQWRGKNKPTNILSFPMLSRVELLDLPIDGPPELLGDIALARETCADEAAEKAIPLADHAAHLVIHGLLHLAGYDHETSRDAAQAMEALEIKALAQLGIADPYGDHHDFQG